MLLLDPSPEGLERAAAILKSGGLAAFPTETVYGLGADAFNPRPLARVFEVKGRPRFDPLIVHIAGTAALGRIAALEALAPRRRKLLERLIGAFWPGPLTLVLPKRPEVPGLVSAGLPTVAVRLPAHRAARKLIELSTGAVAAPSANPFGRLSPTRAEHVVEGLGDRIDCVLDGGPCAVGVESTVLDLAGSAGGEEGEGPVLRVLRPGGISREELEAAAGEAVAGGPPGDRAAGEGAPSPGTLKSHYAPGTPLYLHGPEEMTALPRRPDEGRLFFSGKTRDAWLSRERRDGAAGGDERAGRRLTLSETGDPREAAANLFEYLRRLDRAGVSRILAEAAPEEGLGAAINDRLRRAAVNGPP
ncbi:MAG: threonylcarbamoyl-AMP synthase [Treponema sp.]|jgi:L-threonylcarbamoyladenylate synthase|nr:threonylcarbamoyl-AMP synthase [Treponema sp.]